MELKAFPKRSQGGGKKDPEGESCSSNFGHPAPGSFHPALPNGELPALLAHKQYKAVGPVPWSAWHTTEPSLFLVELILGDVFKLKNGIFDVCLQSLFFFFILLLKIKTNLESTE